MTTPPPSARLTLGTLRHYQRSDVLSGVLICCMLIFGPWAFGTTQRWSIWTMNICGYCLGGLLLAKHFIRARFNYRPARWEIPDPSEGRVTGVPNSSLDPILDPSPTLQSTTGYPPSAFGNPSCPVSWSEISNHKSEIGNLQSPSTLGAGPVAPNSRVGGFIAPKFYVGGLALFTLLILGYCLVSALNARATYDWQTGSLVYRDAISWLPHSYDAPSTWRVFWNYLALACFFWSLRDWLLGLSSRESRAFIAPKQCGGGSPVTASLPSRLRWLLWLLSLNGALLAVEGIAQRLSNTNKLLWLKPTRLNREARSQFGPFAYRANGAQYLNLIWPVSLGFWWTLRRQSRRERQSVSGDTNARRHWLLPCILVMAAAPIISTSRGGAIVAVGMVFVAGGILMFAMRRRHPLTRFFAVLFLSAVFALGAYLGGDQLMERLGEFNVNFAGREVSYDMARVMTRDHMLFGVGPGAFEPVFQFYRSSLDDYWPAQLHNDWLETLITFGWVGSALIALAFLLNLTRAYLPGGLVVRWPLVSLLWLTLAGCLLHARWDFPFQIYSIVLLFLALCASLSTLSLRAQPS